MLVRVTSVCDDTIVPGAGDWVTTGVPPHWSEVVARLVKSGNAA